MAITTFYEPPDVDEAHEAWGANCGPCALAAILRRTVESVHPLFADFARRKYVNPTHMKAALDMAGARWQPTPGAHLNGDTLAAHGLSFIQFDGPWCQPGAPVTVAYRQTHWVASASGWVYDANGGGWLTRAGWEEDVMPFLLEHVPKSTGWWVRTGIEVLLPLGAAR